MFDGLESYDKGQALYLAILLLVILASSATLRGAGAGRLLKMAGAWIAIFAAILVVSAYREEAGAVLARIAGEADPARGTVEGGEFRVRARSDGHFWVRADVDGQSVLFLVDTGASGIVLTADAADRIGIDRSRLVFDQLARTANGTVRGASARVRMIEVGPIVRTNMRVSVTEGALDTNLLGMDFMRTLSGWRVEGDTLIMRP
jgi:aspartyl protease family protein